MPYDKIVDSSQLDDDLTAIADSIRAKSETASALAFPGGMIQAINDISTGITPSGSLSINANGTYDVTDKASAVVNVSGGDDFIHESGSLSLHSGVNITNIKIPVSDHSLDHYLLKVTASKSWLYMNSEWVAQSGINLNGVTSRTGGIIMAFVCAIGTPLECRAVLNATGGTISAAYRPPIVYYSINETGTTVSVGHGYSDLLMSDAGVSVTIDRAWSFFCKQEVGFTYDYEIWGWND